MKATGIVRPVDPLGRVVIPVELRRTLGIKTDDSLEVFVDGDYILSLIHISRRQEREGREERRAAGGTGRKTDAGYLYLQKGRNQAYGKATRPQQGEPRQREHFCRHGCGNQKRDGRTDEGRVVRDDGTDRSKRLWRAALDSRAYRVLLRRGCGDPG